MHAQRLIIPNARAINLLPDQMTFRHPTGHRPTLTRGHIDRLYVSSPVPATNRKTLLHTASCTHDLRSATYDLRLTWSCLPSVALLIFLPTAAPAWIVTPDLLLAYAPGYCHRACGRPWAAIAIRSRHVLRDRFARSTRFNCMTASCVQPPTPLRFPT